MMLGMNIAQVQAYIPAKRTLSGKTQLHGIIFANKQVSVYDKTTYQLVAATVSNSLGNWAVTNLPVYSDGALFAVSFDETKQNNAVVLDCLSLI